MNRWQRLSRLTHLLLLVALVVNVALPASLLAQETTPDPNPPVETTPEATPTETSPVATPTEPTPVVIPPTAPPTTGTVFTTDFSTFDTTPFLTTGDWAIVGADTVFTSTSPSATAVLNGLLWDDVILVARVVIAPTGEALIGVRVGAEGYAVRISDTGNATLWRGDVLLGGLIAPITETTPDPLATPQIYDVAISAVDGAISVAVDNVTVVNITDPAPLAAGYITFGTSPTSAGTVGYDNLFVQAQVPVTSETPVTPTETPIVIPPLDPTPDTETPVFVEPTDEPVVEEPTDEPVVEEPTDEPVVEEPTDEPVVELTEAAETTPEAEMTPEAEVTPEPEETPEVTATPVPLSLDEAEIVKLQGNIWGLLEAYYAGDMTAARAFAAARYMRWLDDDRLQVWVYPTAPENIPAITAYLLELGGEVLYMEDEYIDVIVALEVIVTLARDGRIAAITLPVFATPTGADTPATSAIGTPKKMASTGTGSIIPFSLDQIGVSSWHEANILGNGVNIAVIDVGFNGITNTGERACVGNTNVVGGLGTGNHGLNVIEVLCDVAPQAKVYPYTANSVSTLATAIDNARLGGVNGFPAAHVIVITLDPGGTSTTLTNALANAFNNNIPVIVSAGNGGGAKNNITFSFSAGSPITTISANVRAGDTIVMDQSVSGNPTTIQQVGGSYSDNNSGIGTGSHSYVIGSACGDICQVQITITRNNADPNYNISATWTQTAIVPDNTVTVSGGASQLLPYSESQDVLAVGSVCSTQQGRFPLTSSSPQGSSSQANTARMKPDLVATSHVNTSLLTGASSGTFPNYNCSGGFGGSSAAAAHVAGMAALVISNPNMYGIYNVTSGRPWQLFSYLKSRALDVNGNGYDRAYGAGVAQLGNPNYNLFFERTLNFNADRAGLTIANTYYVSSDRLSNFNILNNSSAPTIPVPDGTINNPFTHITHALEAARTNASITNIVLLPGEYPTAFNIVKNNLNIYGYDFADSGDHPPTAIWVNDIAGNAGVNIINGTNITIAGMQFVGSDPDFMFNSPPEIAVRAIVPLFVQNSMDIVIEGNSFSQFDQPIEVLDSGSVTFRANTFSQFVVDAEAAFGGAAVLWIRDSGGTSLSSSTTINVEHNLFTNNTIGASVGSRLYNSLVTSQRSSARIYGNRFVNNTVPSAIAIDMWQDYPNRIDPPVKIGGRNVIFSNLIADNTFSGPVIHLMQGNRFQFVNNTVANNLLTNNNWLTMIGLGGRDEAAGNVFGDINADHLWDINNNLFFANRRASDNSAGVLNFVSEQAGLSLNFDCKSLANVTQQGARFNWFISSGAQYAGDCSGAGKSLGTVASPANGNIYTNIDTVVADNILVAAEINTFYTANFFTTANDPDHPYRLRPDATTDGVTLAADPNPALVMDGFIVTVDPNTTILTSKNPASDARALDPTTNPRFVDQTDLSFDVVDYGAYELSKPDPVEFFNNTGGAYSAYSAGNFTFTVNEDGVAFIDMTRMVRKGFKPYTVEIVPNVTIYDTNPLNSCNGQPYLYEPTTYILAYCPPADFHNVGVTAPITFQYRVTGLFGTGTIPSPTTYATVNVVVSPANDGGVTTGTQKHATDFTTTIQVPLRPRYTLDASNNFLTLPDASGTNNRDYPFSFSGFTETSDPNNLLDGPNLPSMISGGVFTYTAPPGATQGEFSFTYTATDQDGNSATRTLTMRVVDKILTSGIHDNTALGVKYSGTWTPIFQSNAYQSSLHSTTQNGAQARFNFTGDNFAISYIGNGSTNGAITIELDSDGEGFGSATYTNVYSIAGLTCSTVTPAAGNPIQTAVTGRIVIRCTGIEALPGAAGEVHSVRITTGNSNAFRLDWVQVDGQPLTIGMYEDTDLRPYLTATTFTANAQASGGTYEDFSSTSQMRFSVAPTVRRMVIFRQITDLVDNFKVDLSGNGCSVRTVVVNNYVIAFSMFNQPYTIDLGGCTDVVISRNNNTTTNVGIDRIQLLGVEQRLGVGTYHPKDLYEYFRGRNGTMPQSRAVDGLAQRLLSTTGDAFSFDVTSDVKTVILYRDNYSLRDPIRVQTTICGNPAHQQLFDVTSTGPDSGPFLPFVVSLNSCTRVSFTRVPITAAPAFDRLILTSEVPSGSLGIGMYDNTQLKNYFNSSAVLTANVNAMNGSYHVLPGGANLSFTVSPGVQRMMVYRPISDVAADLRVDLSGSCTPTSKILNSYVIAFPVWGQGHIVNLGGCTNVTISRDTTSGRTQPIGIEAIQLMGAEPLLTAGEYHPKDLQAYFEGRNGIMPQSRAVGGVAQRLLSITGDAFAFNVPQSVDTIVLYRDNYSVRDPINIVTSSCTIGADAQNYNVNNTGADAGPFEPTIILMKTCTRIKITRVPVTAAPAFDRLILYEGLPANLPIGEYDNLQLGSLFTNSTALGNSAASNGSWHRFDTGGQLSFTVDSSVKRMVVFRQIDDVRDSLRVTLSGGGGCTPGVIVIDNFVVAFFMWNQPYTINLNNCTNVLIQANNTPAKTGATGIDRIQLLGAEQPLGLGSYHTVNLYEYFRGRNGELVDSRAQNGIAQRILSTTSDPFSFNVGAGVSRVVLYRHNYNARDPIRVVTSVGGGCTPQDFNVSNDGGEPDFSHPIVVNLNGCTNIAFYRVPVAAAPVIERIELLPAPQPTLTSGNLYEEFHPGLAYSGTWTQATLVVAQSVPSHRMLVTSQLNASVSFNMTGNGFIVYHRVASGASNNVEVCVTTGSNPPVCTNYSTQNSTTINQFPVGIYGLGNGTHTVTITNKQAGGNLFIDAIRIP